MADSNPTPPAQAAKPAFAPKIGSFCYLTEQDPKKRDVPPSVSLFLVTAVGSASAAKRDAKGQVITKQVQMPVGPDKQMKMVTVADVETVSTYNGLSISAEKQFTEPRRGVLIDALSPLEV